MKYHIEITDTPKSDNELYAAVVLILQLPNAPVAAKARAFRDLTSFSAQLGQFETGQFHRHPDRTPIIKGPIDPEAGLDKVWRLVWPSAGY